jgi:hypothetical protein
VVLALAMTEHYIPIWEYVKRAFCLTAAKAESPRSMNIQ